MSTNIKINKGIEPYGLNPNNDPENNVSYSAVTSEKVEITNEIIDRINGLHLLNDELFNSRFESIEADKVARDNALGMKAQLIASEKTVVLPEGLTRLVDDPVAAIVCLAKKLNYQIRVFDSGDKDYVMSIPEETKQLCRGIMLGALKMNNQKVNIGRKSQAQAQGVTLLRAAQIVGYFAENNRHKFLSRNHYFFANNPGEVVTINKRDIHIDPAKDMYSQFFKTDGDILSEILYSLMKKSYSILEEEIIEDFKNKYTLSFGSYVHLFESQNFTTEHKGRRGKKVLQTVARVPSKPKSRSLFTPGEFEILLNIHKDLYETLPFSTKKELFTKEIWSKNFEQKAKDLHLIIIRRSEFLQKFARITTRRLQESRKHLNIADKRKADLTQKELEAVLCARVRPLESLLSELISMNTPSIQCWMRGVLDLEPDEEVILSRVQKYELAENIFPYIQLEDTYRDNLSAWKNYLWQTRTEDREEFPEVSVSNHFSRLGSDSMQTNA